MVQCDYIVKVKKKPNKNKCYWSWVEGFGPHCFDNDKKALPVSYLDYKKSDKRIEYS